MMVHNRFNFNQNQGEGASFKRDSSADSLTRKEESVSRSGHNGGNDGGAAAGGGGGAAAGKSGFTIAKIIAILALVLALIAMGLSIYCTLLWWDWPWVITAPALVLAIVALIFAFAFKGHDEAVLCCAAIGAILALAALIWCAVEIAWCKSYQGPLHKTISNTGSGTGTFLDKNLLDQYEFIKSGGSGGGSSGGGSSGGGSSGGGGGGSELKALAFLYKNGHFCRGRIFDWSYKKEEMMLKTDCQRKYEKWYMDKYLSKLSHCTATKIVDDVSNVEVDAYKGVDTYEQSPIHKTHADIVEGNKIRYPKNSLLHSEKELRNHLDKFCAKFDAEVDKFIEARKKCDDEVKEKLKPECKKKLGGMLYTTSEEEYKKMKKDRSLCKFGEKESVYEWSKFKKAVGDGVTVQVPNPHAKPGDPDQFEKKHVKFTKPKNEKRTPKELDETNNEDGFCKSVEISSGINGVKGVNNAINNAINNGFGGK